MTDLAVELGGHVAGVADVPTVHEPEAGRDRGGEGDAVLDESKRRRPRDVLPLSS